MKTIAFKPVKPASPDDWVKSATPLDREVPVPTEPMKRFTIDVPAQLHCRVKAECARRGAKMADVLREILEREFPLKS
jgi:hypothetical protein